MDIDVPDSGSAAQSVREKVGQNGKGSRSSNHRHFRADSGGLGLRPKDSHRPEDSHESIRPIEISSAGPRS